MSQGTSMIPKAYMSFGKVSKSISEQYLKSHYIQSKSINKINSFLKSDPFPFWSLFV